MTREEIPALSVLMVADVEPKPQTETTALTSHLEKRAEHKMTDTLELAHSPDPLEDNDDRGDVEPPTSTLPNPMLEGIYHCTHCDNIEAKEREVICWKCGEGEMVWVSGERIRALLNSPDVVPNQVYESAVRGRAKFRNAYRGAREVLREARRALITAERAINPGDRESISLHEWNERLKSASATIHAAIIRSYPSPPGEASTRELNPDSAQGDEGSTT